MNFLSTRIPYRQADTFTPIILDYLDRKPGLESFYAWSPAIPGIQQAIDARTAFPTDRKALVDTLQKQYSSIEAADVVKKNIASLASPACFTVTTAHQPNIFTGPLYFIYKILHAIKLAAHLQELMPKYRFVPVYYMGTEDADLEELGHIYLGGKKVEWKTKQKGAVGRMKVDAEFLKLVDAVEGQLSVLPYGAELIKILREAYRKDETIQDATFKLVNKLFGEWGLIVFNPDHAALKKQMLKVFEEDLLNQAAAGIVEKTSAALGQQYKIQVNPREINLFYLKDDIRERIVELKGEWRVLNGGPKFSKAQLQAELHEHPERFSPNVVLRGIYQATILPDIIFTGGGGELAYWLQLKGLFEHYKVPFPVLLLRNSFLVVEKKWQEKITKLGFTVEDFFRTNDDLLNSIVARESGKKLKLNGTITETEQIYKSIKKQVKEVDSSLEKHVEALKLKTIHRLQELEKKMLRAEKRRFSDQQRQLQTIKEHLFPSNGLQERHDNLFSYYAKWGKDFIQKVYDHSLSLEQEFTILIEK